MWAMWVLLCLLAAPLALAVHPADLLPVHARGGRLYEELLAAQRDDDEQLRTNLGLPPGWAPNKTASTRPTWLDNFAAHDASSQTFQQRFFYDTTFCGSECGNPATPVVCEFSGEWTARGALSGAAAELASSLNAVTCNLEHRWYGASLPTSLSDKALMQQTLSVEQAIEDTATFVVYFESLLAGAAANATPPSVAAYAAQRQWIIVGGSYAGALVTWFTVKHGALVASTWASSGVVDAIFNFTAFDETVVTAVGPDCTAALQAVTAAAETYWDDPVMGPQMLALFNVPNISGWFSKGDFFWMLSDAGAMAPQYGQKDLMCSYLNVTARPVPPEASSLTGAAAATAFPTGWEAVVAFANWTQDRYGTDFAGCYYSTLCLSDATYNASWLDGTTWVWQCCSEVAYWQIAYPGAIRSAALDAAYFVGQCQAAYGPSTFPDTVAFNAVYGGATPNVAPMARVWATGGSDDPWQPACVRTSVSANYSAGTAVCDGCSHCRDLQASSPSDPPALSQLRARLLSNMTAWVQPGPGSVAVPAGTAAGPSAGAVAGIVIGVLAAAALAAGAAVWHIQRRKRTSASAAAGAYTSMMSTGKAETAAVAGQPDAATFY